MNSWQGLQPLGVYGTILSLWKRGKDEHSKECCGPSDDNTECSILECSITFHFQHSHIHPPRRKLKHIRSWPQPGPNKYDTSPAYILRASITSLPWYEYIQTASSTLYFAGPFTLTLGRTWTRSSFLYKPHTADSSGKLQVDSTSTSKLSNHLANW